VGAPMPTEITAVTEHLVALATDERLSPAVGALMCTQITAATVNALSHSPHMNVLVPLWVR
jgi:hypothetical protein